MNLTSLDQLKAKLQELSEHSNELEMSRAACKGELEKKRVLIRDLNGKGNQRQTIFGTLFGGKKLAELKELNDDISALTVRIAGLTQGIENSTHDAERAIDDYLAENDDHYRTESMRWNAVMRLKHGAELYRKETERALGFITGLRDDEHARADKGLRSREWNEITSHSFYEHALQTIKSAYEKFGSAVEDVHLHDKKVSCKITITYHGGSMTFDIYDHPENLSLYRIDSLEQFIGQLEGLRDAIKTILVHAESQYRLTVAERLRCHNRVRKSL